LFCLSVSIFLWQGAEHEEFVKAATAENEVQFVETTDRNVAKVLFPGIASEEQFLGLVKSEPEKFEKFGKYPLHMFRCFCFVHYLHFCIACHALMSK
jgi:hypothetical protein